MTMYSLLLFVFLIHHVQGLYQLKNGILSGPNVNLNIALDTHPILPSTNRFQLISDQFHSNIPPSSHVRMGKGFAVVYGAGAHADQVLGIWGNGLKLVPVDRVLLPGAFKNVARAIKGSMEMAFPPSDTTIKLSDDAQSRMAMAGNASRMVNRCAPGRARQFLEVAVAYDHTFCALFGGDERVASALVQSIVDLSNVAYKRDTCIQLALVHIEANCNRATDPYRRYSDFEHLRNDKCSRDCANPPCSPPSLMLRCFGTFWKNNRANVHRDSAYLLTGFEDGTGYAGLAYVGASCLDFYAYGWIQGPSFETFAHEAAHTLGANHHSVGIMRPGDIPNFKFSDFSVSQITKFINTSPFSFCIEGTKPKCDRRTCPANCRGDNKCIVGPPAIAPSLVPCTPASLYYCAETKDGFNLGIDCPSQFGFVKRQFNPSDELVFCCRKPVAVKRERVILRTYTLGRIIYRDDIRSQLYINHIPDSDAIEDATLMKTEMVPCGDTVPRISTTPTPSRRPRKSRKPKPTPTRSPTPTPSRRPRKTRTPTPSPTRSPTPTPTRRPRRTSRPRPPSATPSPTPTRSRTPLPTQFIALPFTCSQGSNPELTFSCVDKRLVTSFQHPNIAPVHLYLKQKSGLFTTWFEKEPGTRVRWAARMVTTDPDYPVADLLLHFIDLNEGSFRLLRESINPFDLPLVERTCCHQLLYIYVKIRMCNTSLKVCETFTRVAMSRITCERPCISRREAVVPFSKDEQCPRCAGGSRFS